jgi:hypothetical protein
MAEYDGLTFAPVLVVDLDVFGIFLADTNVWHWRSPFILKNFKSVRFLTTALLCCDGDN